MNEKEISKNTGVSKRTLMELRNKIPKTDWISEKGVGIIYKPSGLHILAKILGLTVDQLTANHPKQWAKVVKLSKYKQIVLIETIPDKNGKGRALRMKVKDNSKFMKGMTVPIRSIIGDVCYLARKLPRVKGKW